MEYLELFELAADFVRRQDVDVIFNRGPSLTRDAIQKLSPCSFITMPPSLADFYFEIGDGLAFRWFAGSDDSAPFANIEIPPLVKMMSFESVKSGLEWDDTYTFPHAQDPVLAKKTSLHMRRWIRFHEEGNGDAICLDTSVEPAAVVYDDCNWLAETCENGHVLGRSLAEFLNKWSKVCFQFPSSLWWPNLFREPAGVDWTSDEFSQKFQLR